MSRKVTLASLIVVICVATVAVLAAEDKVEVKGMIKNRTGDTLTIATDSGDKTVVLTDSTRTKDDRGLFGLEKEEQSMAVLIPGLKVDIDGTPDPEGRVTAQTITVDGDDLEASQMIQAGLHPTAEQVQENVQRLETHQKGIEANQQNIAANQQNVAEHKQMINQNLQSIEQHTQRFLALDDFDVKQQATVNFKTGTSTLLKPDEDELKKLAENTKQLSGYLVEVTGYADSTGNAAMNTKLSEDRAKAVITYLTQQGGIPIRRIVAPGAMGEYGSAAPNETKMGRAQNRRVEVKVLVNKGIAQNK